MTYYYYFSEGNEGYIYEGRGVYCQTCNEFISPTTDCWLAVDTKGREFYYCVDCYKELMQYEDEAQEFNHDKEAERE